jgi:hypothetical protein
LIARATPHCGVARRAYISGDMLWRSAVNDKHKDRPESFKGDVEILPPEDGRASSGGYAYSFGHGTIKIVKLGPLASAFVGLAVCGALFLGFLFLSGALLLLLPVLGLLIVAAALAGIFNNPFKRLR